MEVGATDALSDDIPVRPAGDQGHAVLVHDVLQLLSDLTHLRGVVGRGRGGERRERGGGGEYCYWTWTPINLAAFNRWETGTHAHWICVGNQ